MTLLQPLTIISLSSTRCILFCLQKKKRCRTVLDYQFLYFLFFSFFVSSSRLYFTFFCRLCLLNSTQPVRKKNIASIHLYCANIVCILTWLIILRKNELSSYVLWWLKREYQATKSDRQETEFFHGFSSNVYTLDALYILGIMYTVSTVQSILLLFLCVLDKETIL